ncbi:hypothetical protein [Andreprevotia chitinilytica]|uniref:hypothetical protein n=1 Tax=Andreprevotia chitinilytica TaxID=396808 RepID=UPI000556E479|nr:hypothetical protein [Andreprevotia chitinilytica]
MPNIAESLGPLAALRGVWMGEGFSQILLPISKADGNLVQTRNELLQARGAGNQIPPPFRLKLNATEEILEFELPDKTTQSATTYLGNNGNSVNIQLFGLKYVQNIEDPILKKSLHHEPGLWLYAPSESDDIAYRQGLIPHGNTLLVRGKISHFSGEELSIPDANSFATPALGSIEEVMAVLSDAAVNAWLPGGVAFPTNDPALLEKEKEHVYLPLDKENTFPTSDSFPKKIKDDWENQERNTLLSIIKNPNLLLKYHQEKLKEEGKTITKFTRVDFNSAKISNIPFLRKNAAAADMTPPFFSATFWLETVHDTTSNTDHLYLQYAQSSPLTFSGFTWPHLTVATLRHSGPGTR